MKKFESGEVRVLCACDVLNEGWDAPHIEVLLMARPTLSKVIYQQQIGRGMRAHPGKKYLILFDFVDVFGRHNEAMSAHKLTKKPKYKPGERLFGTEQSEDAFDLPLHLWATDYVPVSIFDWQEQIEGMVTAPALSASLRKNEQWIGDKWKTGEIVADEVIDLGGERHIPYFRIERVPELRERYGIAEVTDDTLFDDLLAYLDDAAMTRSYKPVWFLAVLACADARGRASVVAVSEHFWQFYRDRAAAGLVSEQDNSPLHRPDTCSLEDVRYTINRGPFGRFSRLGYVAYAHDTAFLQIAGRFGNVFPTMRQQSRRWKAFAVRASTTTTPDPFSRLSRLQTSVAFRLSLWPGSLSSREPQAIEITFTEFASYCHDEPAICWRDGSIF